MRLDTKFQLISEFDNLELFRAEKIYYHYARHAHATYSVGVIEYGLGGNCYRGSTYLAPPRSIIFMNPEETHTGYSAGDSPLSYRMLYPSIKLMKQIASDSNIKGFPHFKDAFIQDEDLAQKILTLHTTLERSHSQLNYQSLLVETLSEILLNYADAKHRTHRTEPAQEHRAVQLIKEYLHDNFKENISLDRLVEITNLNRYYLIRVFRIAVGIPPYAYLTQIRINKAKQLLQQGLPIADVAIAVGMSDQSHLNRHFKRIMGITPGHYQTMSTSFKPDEL